MKLRTLIASLCITTMALGWIPDGRADEPAGAPLLRLAALDSPDGPPPCGKDNICNIATCPQDPDCDLGELPDRPDTPPNRFPLRTDDVIDCNARQTSEISAAIDWGAENWASFKAALEKIRGWPVTIGNCLEARFQDNGKVVCESSSRGGCTTKGSLNSGFASALNKRCHMCPAYLAKVASLPDPPTNRQACYFAMVTHEWGHTCERGHKTLEIIDDEALEFYKSRHPEVTISLGDCRMG